MEYIKLYNKKMGPGKITLLYFFYIIQILRILHASESLLIFFSRDDFIPENIKKLKITVQVIIIKINEALIILKAIFKKTEKNLF